MYLSNDGSLDVVHFARDLAAQFGAAVTVESIGDGPRDASAAKIHFPAGFADVPGPFTLTLYAVTHPEKDRGKVTVSIRPDDIPNQFLGNSTSQYPALPRVTISTDRPLETLARDVGKRVLVESVESITKRRAVAQQYTDHDAMTKATADSLRAAFPALRITMPDGSNPGAAASFSAYLDGKGDSNGSAYVNGRIQGGSIILDRGSILPAHAVALLLAMYGGDEGKRLLAADTEGAIAARLRNR